MAPVPIATNTLIITFSPAKDQLQNHFSRLASEQEKEHENNRNNEIEQEQQKEQDEHEQFEKLQTMLGLNDLEFYKISRDFWFQDEGLEIIKKLTENAQTLISLRSFHRCLAVYHTVTEAIAARNDLNRKIICRETGDKEFKTELRVYFGAHTEPQWLSPDPALRMTLLSPPKPGRNLLLSPPGELPVGWISKPEEGPSLGGFVEQEEERLARCASNISLLDFTLDGGTSLNIHPDVNGILIEQFREVDGTFPKRYQFEGMDGTDLPLIAIHAPPSDPVIDHNLDLCGTQKRIPQTQMPPINDTER